jgi:hypothetical protein
MIAIYKSNKRIIQLTTAFFALCAGIMLTNQILSVFLNRKQKIGCRAVYQNLDVEHIKIMNGIRDEFKINHSEWQKVMDDFAQLRKSNDAVVTSKVINYKKSADPLTNSIKAVLADRYINPDKVTIAYQPNKGCPLLAIQEFDDNNQIHHKILIDKEWFQERPAHIQAAIIKHEMQHLKHMDSIEGGYVIDFLQEKGYSRAAYERSPAVQAYRHHRELRADLLAAAGDIATAKALQEDFAQCVALRNQEDLRTHPSSKTRYNEMTDLIASMEQNSPIKMA